MVFHTGRRLGIAVAALIFVGGCSTTQSRSLAHVQINGADFDQMFQAATTAAVTAGFTIDSANKDTGLINATRGASGLVTWQNPAINILVQKNSAGTQIQVASTVRGQLVEGGTVRNFCSALHSAVPSTNCVFE